MKLFERSVFRGEQKTVNVSYKWQDMPLRLQILAVLCFSLIFITAILAFASGLRAALVSGGACFLCWAAFIPLAFGTRRGVPGAVCGAFAFVGAVLVIGAYLVPWLLARHGVEAVAIMGMYALCALFFGLGVLMTCIGMRKKKRGEACRVFLSMGVGYMAFGLAAAALCWWLLQNVIPFSVQ